MKTAYFLLASALVLGLGACSSDDDETTTPAGTGGAASGGAATGGAATGGAATGGAATGGTGGGGGAAIVDACVGSEAELTAAIEGDPSLFDLAADCGRNVCIGQLGTPGLRPCVAECLAMDVTDLPDDCLNCVAFTVESGGSSACIGKCLVDAENCGPSGDLSCCTECLCNEGTFDKQATCMGVPSTTDCTVYN